MILDRDEVASHERSTLILMLFLLGVLVFHPLFGGQAFESREFNVLNGIGLVISLFSLRGNRQVTKIAAWLALPCLLLNGFAMWQPLSPNVDLFGHALLIVFYAVVTWGILQHIIFSHSIRVRRETLYESVCVYLLLGLLWGTLYSFIEHLSPGSFHLAPDSYSGALGWSDFLYHSFVTLTTVGYGDLVPVAPMARSFTVLEAVAGVFYTTALIARLVSVYRPEESDVVMPVQRSKKTPQPYEV